MKFRDRVGLLFKNNFEEYVQKFMTGADLEETTFGQNMDSTTAMKYSAVFACNKVLAETFACMPAVLYLKDKNGEREAVNDLAIFDILHNAPNEEMSPFNFKEALITSLNLGGNTVSERLIGSKGQLVGLYPYEHSKVVISRDKNTKKLIYTVKDGTESKVLTREQVFHVPNLSLDGIIGLSPITYAASAIWLGTDYLVTIMIEVQDIFAEFGQKYCDEHNLPFQLRKVILNIIACRTAQLGGHVDECDKCGHTKISYNSCRDRHCPKCQSLSKERWIDNRKEDLLPIPYFHVVFTIPHELEFLTLINKKEMYSVLFKATSETLLELSRDHKYLGAEIGFTTIIHSWGSNLMNHTHTHNIVPSGGLSLDGQRWINSKKDFFIPVTVLSRKFRGKFLYYLKQKYYANKFKFINEIEDLRQKDIFQCFVDKLYNKEWVVYCKPPFGGAEHVIEYLGRYTYRVAISNNRIVAFENGLVVFKWKDYKDNSKEKHMTVTAEEFIRRFLLHVLPRKFVKIRHYGILSNRNRMTKLKKCKQILKVSISKIMLKVKLTTAELFFKLTGVDINKCPCCSGKMMTRRKLKPKRLDPPEEISMII